MYVGAGEGVAVLLDLFDDRLFPVPVRLQPDADVLGLRAATGWIVISFLQPELISLSAVRRIAISKYSRV